MAMSTPRVSKLSLGSDPDNFRLRHRRAERFGGANLARRLIRLTCSTASGEKRYSWGRIARLRIARLGSVRLRHGDVCSALAFSCAGCLGFQ